MTWNPFGMWRHTSATFRGAGLAFYIMIWTPMYWAASRSLDLIPFLCISQSVTLSLLIILCITYKPPRGTPEEIDSPFRLEGMMHEDAGRFICFDFALWCAWWTWLDSRFIPLGIVAFFGSFFVTPRIVLGHPNLFVTRFPKDPTLYFKDVEKHGV